MIKYTRPFLTKLENLVAESEYILRYEKGNFKSGYCLLLEQKIILVNKFYTIEGKINALLDIFQRVTLSTKQFTEQNKLLYKKLCSSHSSIGSAS